MVVEFFERVDIFRFGELSQKLFPVVQDEHHEPVLAQEAQALFQCAGSGDRDALFLYAAGKALLVRKFKPRVPSSAEHARRKKKGKDERGEVGSPETGIYKVAQNSRRDQKGQAFQNGRGAVFEERSKRDSQNSASVEGIGRQKVYEEKRKGNGCRRLGEGVRIGKEPPKRGKADRRQKVYERSRKRHEKFFLRREPRNISRYDRAVGHEHDFIEAEAVPPCRERVRAFVLDRRKAGA